MKRHQEDKKIAERNWKERLRSLKSGASEEEIEKFIKDHEVGRFRKKDAYDCGDPQCFVCHSDKVGKMKDIQILKSDISFKEQLEE